MEVSIVHVDHILIIILQSATFQIERDGEIANNALYSDSIAICDSFLRVVLENWEKSSNFKSLFSWEMQIIKGKGYRIS